MSSRTRGRVYLRHLWSHRSPVHIAAVKVYNGAMARVPMQAKYRTGLAARRRKPPYSFLADGVVAVQVGAPADTLEAGRSRGMYFSLLTAPHGRCVIIEPDLASAAAFRRRAADLGLDHVVVVESAVWSEPTTLTLRIADDHPAANFIEGAADYSDEEKEKFRVLEVPAEPIDGIVERLELERVDVISITTNGSEIQALVGAERTIAKGVRLVALARTADRAAFDPWLTARGFTFVSFDDRGFTYVRAEAIKE